MRLLRNGRQNGSLSGRRLSELMAARGLHNTTDLIPLLAERGITLSRPQVYRLVNQKPERVALRGCQVFCVRDRSVIRSAGWSDRKSVGELNGESVQCLVPALGACSELAAAGGLDVSDPEVDQLDRGLVGGK